ncbi:nuclear transport factor 2 family protein [Grimontia kaedaensis]|uniref:Nuclear transport factor 2 family protein n=1 Tax=Grimontia kaedaensis TaxID=2872157 RepID=A0ABY4WZN0_9GAMM|nr:nuclear transport factor 2 family protein [Grimontia kaedaensis]USH04421.1 nuclear transport factor 2 family protein [Grimontia kaedaensis]
MSVDNVSKNMEVARTYFQAVQTGDLETLGALVAPNVVWYQPGNNRFSGKHEGAQAVFGMIGGMMEMSVGSFKIETFNVVGGNEDKVAVIVEFSAEREGLSMRMVGVDLITIVNGKIVEAWLYSADQVAEDTFWGN